LRRAADIARVREQRCVWSDQYLRLYAARGTAEHSRIALVVSARLGSAVVRNRLRRLLRQAFASHMSRPEPPLDLVAIARPQLCDAPLATVVAVVDRAMRRCLSQPVRGAA
jgi:ribonuclease P protein component